MSLPALKLVSFSLCAYVQRARIVLNETSLPHELEYIDLDTPPDWFFDVSPMEKVPVLLVDGEPLFESMVICEYLNDISGGHLYPQDAFERAHQRSWIGFGDGLLGVVYDLLQAREEADFKRARAVLIDRLEILEESCSIPAFFAGAQFGMVDVAYTPVFRFLDAIRAHTALDFYAETPQIQQWAGKVLSHNAVQQSVPEDYPAQLKQYLAKPDTVLKSLMQ